ncbi:MAG: oligosaccharide flippase family protein [Planctomycetota bacterium]|nr:oligosaccharide flippase family protein [Planctomycetota bacterium]
MHLKGQLLRNLNWNWAGIFIDTLVAFLLCPYLVNHLGATNYGAWVMIGSLTGYFGLLDFGIRGSVGRYVAFYRAQQDHRAMNEIVSAALVMLTVAGVVGLLGTVAAGFWANLVIGQDFDPRDLFSVQFANFLCGVNLALLLPLSVFDGILWGCQRFDRLNYVRIPADAARGLLSALVVASGGTLIALSAVALAITVVGGVAKLIMALKSAPELRLRLVRVDRSRVREVASFGIWNSLRSFATMIPQRVTPLLVGVMLSVSLVAPLSIAARLIACASAILVAATGVITPIATALHAQQDRRHEHQLLLAGGKYSLAAATLFLALFVLLGKPLIHLWVGPDLALAYPLLAIMAVGRWASMSQVVTRGMITAQNKHRALALATVSQGVVTLILGIVLMQWWGVAGLVAAIALGDAVCEGGFSLVYGCRLLGYSPLQYLRSIASTSLIALTVPCGLLAAVTWWRPVSGWLDLVLYGATFALVSVASVVGVIEQPNLGDWLPRLRGSRAGLAESPQAA